MTYSYGFRGIIVQYWLPIVEEEDDRGIIDRFYVDCDHISCVGRRNIWVALLLIHRDINILCSWAILTWGVDQTESDKYFAECKNFSKTVNFSKKKKGKKVLNWGYLLISMSLFYVWHHQFFHMYLSNIPAISTG